MAGTSGYLMDDHREDDDVRLMDRLRSFFEVLLKESGKIVDDTHLSKVIDGLSICEEERDGFLLVLVETTTLNFISLLAECLNSEVDRVKVFAIQTVGLFARYPTAFSRLLPKLQDQHMSCSSHPQWWEELLQSGSTSVQFAVLSMVRSLTEHSFGREWIAGSKLVHKGLDCVVNGSFYVGKAATEFLASCIVRQVILVEQTDQQHRDGTVSHLIHVVNQALLRGEDTSGALRFYHALSIVAKAIVMTVGPNELHLNRFFSAFPPLLELSLQLKLKTDRRDCQYIVNILKLLPSKDLFTRALSPSVLGRNVTEHVLDVVESLFTKRFHSIAFSLLETLTRGECVDLTNIYFLNFLLDIFLFILSTASSLPFAPSEMPDTMKEIVKSSTSSDASLLFAATGHLKDLLHQKDSGPLFDIAMRQRIVESVCALLSPIVTHTVGESSHLPIAALMGASVKEELVIQDLLAVASGCITLDCDEMVGGDVKGVATVQELYDIVIDIIRNMNIISTKVVCMALLCLSAVVKHGILTKSITNSKSEEAKGIRIPTLPEVLQLCMQSDNWEVKDSCIELVGEVYQCCVQPDSEAFDPQAPSLLQWFGAHQVVLQSLAEEDHSVRSTGVAVLCLLAHKKTVLVEFCTTQGVREEDLFQLVVDLSTSDVSATVRTAAWDCIAHWHTCPECSPALIAFSSLEHMDHLNRACTCSITDEDHEVRTAAVKAVEQVAIRGFMSLMGEGPVEDSVFKKLDICGFLTRDFEEDERVLHQLCHSSEVILSEAAKIGTPFCSAFCNRLFPIALHLKSVLDTQYRSCPTVQLTSILEEITTSAVAVDSKFTEADCY